MRTRTLPSALLIVGVALVLGACGPAGPLPRDEVWDRIEENEKIVVGVSMDYPPYEYVNEQFIADGFDIAFIGELSKQMELPMDVKNYAFEGLGDALQNGDIDIAISAISITDEREEEFDFSNVYLTDTSAVLTLPTSTIVITAPGQLAFYRVGVQRGSVYESYMQQVLVDTGLMPATRLYSFITPDDALTALEQKQIDVFVLDTGTAKVYAEANNLRIAGQGSEPQRYAVAMANGTPILQDEINQAIQALQNDGTLARLAREYLNLDPSAVAPGCTDGMAYVADVTYDDENMTDPPDVAPNQSFVKTWRVKNTGSCTWVSGYQLAYAYGNTSVSSMGGQPVPITTPVAPGAETDLSVTLTAPTTPGTYQGFWQMVNDHDTPFGQTIWVGVTVIDPSQPTPAPIPAPVITSFTISPTTITRGQCITAAWTVSGDVNNVVFERDGLDLLSGAPASGQYQDCPPNAGQVDYALGAYGPGGSDLEHITITVNQPAPTAVPPTAVPPTAVPPANPLVGPTWNALTIDNASVDPSLGIYAIFFSNGQVEGFDGCNTFLASYQSFEDQIDVSGLPTGPGVSNCLPENQAVSTAFLVALDQVTNFSVSGNTLSMRDASGAQRLQFTK